MSSCLYPRGCCTLDSRGVTLSRRDFGLHVAKYTSSSRFVPWMCRFGDEPWTSLFFRALSLRVAAATHSHPRPQATLSQLSSHKAATGTVTEWPMPSGGA